MKVKLANCIITSNMKKIDVLEFCDLTEEQKGLYINKEDFDTVQEFEDAIIFAEDEKYFEFDNNILNIESFYDGNFPIFEEYIHKDKKNYEDDCLVVIYLIDCMYIPYFYGAIVWDFEEDTYIKYNFDWM